MTTNAMTETDFYPLPPAISREQIAAALTSDDPPGTIREWLAALDRHDAWSDAERTKLNHAMSLARMDGGPASASTSASSAERLDLPASRPSGATNGRPTRREGILAILRSDTSREWKLAEIVAELKKRDWATGSKHESMHVMSVLSDLKKNRVVARPRTGYYRLMTEAPETEGGSP
jgi:hypothetical protein